MPLGHRTPGRPMAPRRIACTWSSRCMTRLGSGSPLARNSRAPTENSSMWKRTLWRRDSTARRTRTASRTTSGPMPSPGSRAMTKSCTSPRFIKLIICETIRTMRNEKPRVGVLLGDPSGIGPEVASKVLAMPETLERAEVLVIGDPRMYRGPQLKFLECAAPDVPVGKVSREAGEYTIEALRLAVATLQGGRVNALVYAPLNKQAMKLAGLGFDDELHFFASLLQHPGPVSEINVCGGLWTSRVTSHVPLREVPGLTTRDKIREAAALLHRTLSAAGVSRPRIAVAGLNPHAGEGGLMGTEEIDTIGPAVQEMRADGIEAIGPLPADTLFVAARRGDFHGVVTMYHDQGQIPMKLLGFERGVTVAGGVPAVITTPAHGTAFDIAGKGLADPGAMREAFRIACEMA